MGINRSSVWKGVIIFCGMMMVASCATMSIPLFKVSVKAIDETDSPIAGAIVESSDGQKATTGADGIAVLKFGSLGVHNITVLSENKAPARLSVTMPLDTNKTMSARLGKPVEISAPVSLGINISGMLTAIYPMIFQSMFTAYGYNMELAALKAGEWTEWDFHSDRKGKKAEMTMRKAFLTRLDNKQEWWQVQMDSGRKKEDRLTFEVLFSGERQSIRRMRQKTGEGQASEVPVTEGWYSPPMQLTPESLEGAVVKKEVDVQVPAGTFKADLLEFAYMGAAGKVRMWRVKSVPGGVVRVELSQGTEPEWITELKAYGTGATTLLGSF
jgi:hypothetical protein